MNIGILGGTFNPIHYGHTFIANYVLDYMELDEIMFIPSGNPPHKDKQIVIDKIHRKNMVELAIKNNNKFSMNSIEIDKEGYSYSYDTLTALIEKNPNSNFYYIIGQDAFIFMDKWYRYKELFEIANFIIVTRGEEIKNKIEDMYKEQNAKMIFVNSPMIDISSTQIRQRLKYNKSIKYFVNEDVEEYILKNKLYNYI